MTDYSPDDYTVLAEAGRARAELAQCEEAFAEVRSGLFALIEASAIGDASVREHAYAGLQVLKSVKQALETAAAKGDMVEKTREVAAILKGGIPR